MKKVFIDGKAGTTGLRIYERLENRDDIVLLTLSEEDRKDKEKRRQMINESDISFLCLPDEASIESVSMVENQNTVIIDTSTAHRTNSDWTYGFPEIVGKDKVANSKRIAVPGCHAGGFVALIYPLVKKGILSPDALLTCHSITGYSGGGKKMIAQYEQEKSALLGAPRQYGLTQNHKHLKEMKGIAGLNNPPVFSPIVSDFYSGMVMTVPIFVQNLEKGKNAEDIKREYTGLYNGEIVKYVENSDEEGFISGAGLSGLDKMEISVFGNEERILLVARYDNLGKGALGAAIQCMNIVMQTDEKTGLSI